MSKGVHSATLIPRERWGRKEKWLLHWRSVYRHWLLPVLNQNSLFPFDCPMLPIHLNHGGSSQFFRSGCGRKIFELQRKSTFSPGWNPFLQLRTGWPNGISTPSPLHVPQFLPDSRPQVHWLKWFLCKSNVFPFRALLSTNRREPQEVASGISGNSRHRIVSWWTCGEKYEFTSLTSHGRHSEGDPTLLLQQPA